MTTKTRGPVRSSWRSANILRKSLSCVALLPFSLLQVFPSKALQPNGASPKLKGVKYGKTPQSLEASGSLKGDTEIQRLRRFTTVRSAQIQRLDLRVISSTCPGTTFFF